MSDETILIVEDEALTAMELQTSLENAGYEGCVVKSAHEALKVVREHPPHLILMDIQLPGEEDGIQATEAISEEVDVPLIYLTGYADEATREQARATQPRAYLTKPILFQELLSHIEAALNSPEKSNHDPS